jgi:hypothetical protein
MVNGGENNLKSTPLGGQRIIKELTKRRSTEHSCWPQRTLRSIVLKVKALFMSRHVPFGHAKSANNPDFLPLRPLHSLP